MNRRKIINLTELKKLMAFKPTLNDCAGFFDCSEDTISRLIKKEDGISFSDFRNKYLGTTRVKLREKAVQMALSGNNTMMIFCLKNLCGWKDQPEFENEPVELEFIYEDEE